MANLFGTPGDDTLTGTSGADLIFSLAGDDTFTFDQAFISNINIQLEDSERIDGGTGLDNVIVSIPGGTPGDGFNFDTYSEVDPILFGGYTHRVNHIEYNALNTAYGVGAQALLRDVETLTRFDGSEVSLTTGSLTWHAETPVTQYNPGTVLTTFDERSVTSLTGGQVARVLQTTEAGSDNRKIVVQVVDGDGTLVFQSQPIGIDYIVTPNFGTTQQTLDPLVVGLPDGGFAVAWEELFLSDPSNLNSGERDTYLQLFDADGTARAAPILIVDRGQRAPVPEDPDLTALPDGRLVYSYVTNGYDFIQYVMNDGGLVEDSFIFNPAFLTDRDHHGVVAYDGGYAMFLLDHSGRTADGQELRTIEMRLHTVDPETGAIAFVSQSTLLTLDPGERINQIAYANLDTNTVAAAIHTDGGRVLLATYVEGVATVQDVVEPFDGQIANSGISLVEAPTGGAYLSFEINTSTSVDGRVFSSDAFAAHVDTTGTIGELISVSDRVGNVTGNNYNPIVAATDDGIFATWRGTGAELLGVSYQLASGYNEITGTVADETFAGTAADDHIRAGDGNDTLVQNAGIDRFDGGAGVDTFVLDPASGGYASLQEGRTGAIDGTGPVEALLNIENLIGTGFADLLGDDGGANAIDAGAGDDTILGYGGADTLQGGEGTDTYRTASDEFNAYFSEIQLGAETGIEVLDITVPRLEGTAESDIFILSGIQSYQTFAEIWLDRGNDVFEGTQAGDNVRGESNDDRLDGQGGNDTLDGGSGNDTIIGGAGDDIMTGGTSFSSGNTFVLRPGEGHDTITDYQQSRDRLDFSAFSEAQLDAISVSLTPTGDRFVTFEDSSTLTMLGVPRNHTPFGSIKVSGVLQQGETLSLDFSGFTDYDGFDPANTNLQWLRAGTPIAGATGATYTTTQDDVGQRLSAEVTYVDLFKTTESRVSSQSLSIANVNDDPIGDVTITGTPSKGQTLAADTSSLSDEDGLGTLNYQWLRSSTPITGETSGSYTLGQMDVGAVITVRVSYVDGEGTRESVSSESTAVIAQEVKQGGSGIDNLEGTVGPDLIYGLEGNDTLSGGDGNDTLEGGDGDDTLDGGPGADVFNGGAGIDRVEFLSAPGRVLVDLLTDASTTPYARFYQNGAPEGDTFVFVENATGGRFSDQFRGDNGANVLDGDNGWDRLYGRQGDDTLIGGLGGDMLYGNAGADTMTGGTSGQRDRFIYFRDTDSGVGESNRDVITDFQSGVDRIEISRIDADTTQRLKQDFNFIADAAFSNTAGDLRYEQTGTVTILQADFDGDGTADFEIELTGTINLQLGDFLL